MLLRELCPLEMGIAISASCGFCVWTVAVHATLQSFRTTDFMCVSSKHDRNTLFRNFFSFRRWIKGCLLTGLMLELLLTVCKKLQLPCAACYMIGYLFFEHWGRFAFYMYSFMHCVHMRVLMCQEPVWDQRTTCGSQFSLLSYGYPGIAIGNRTWQQTPLPTDPSP